MRFFFFSLLIGLRPVKLSASLSLPALKKHPKKISSVKTCLGCIQRKRYISRVYPMYTDVFRIYAVYRLCIQDIPSVRSRDVSRATRDAHPHSMMICRHGKVCVCHRTTTRRRWHHHRTTTRRRMRRRTHDDAETARKHWYMILILQNDFT